jgi:gluconokinase
MVIVLMGVAGSGKTTVGEALAASLGWTFEDADTHHPAANREKMRAGIPLTEDDRRPWLEALAALIRGWRERGENAVLACSALSRRSRAILGVAAPDVALVHLRGSQDLIAERLRHRAGHFFSPSLLDSQFAALEEPDDAVVVSVEPPPADIVAEIRHRLGLSA